MIVRTKFTARKIVAGIFLGFLITGLGIYTQGQWPLALEQAISYIAYPILVIQHKCVTPIKAWFEQRQTVQELARALKELQDEKEQLLSALIQLQGSQDFAQENKELIDFKQRYVCAHAILAQILMKNLSDQAHYCIIDAGANKGIKKNMVAVYKDSVLGKVVEVYPCYSKLLLLTDSSCKIAAYCAYSKASGIHVGTNNSDHARLMHVSHLAPVQEGDLVFSSGDGLIFPRGFALGRVSACEANGLFCDITVQPLVDIRKIQYCYLVQKGNEVVTLLNDSAFPPVALNNPQAAYYLEQFSARSK